MGMLRRACSSSSLHLAQNLHSWASRTLSHPSPYDVLRCLMKRTMGTQLGQFSEASWLLEKGTRLPGCRRLPPALIFSSYQTIKRKPRSRRSCAMQSRVTPDLSFHEVSRLDLVMCMQDGT